MAYGRQPFNYQVYKAQQAHRAAMATLRGYTIQTLATLGAVALCGAVAGAVVWAMYVAARLGMAACS